MCHILAEGEEFWFGFGLCDACIHHFVWLHYRVAMQSGSTVAAFKQHTCKSGVHLSGVQHSLALNKYEPCHCTAEGLLI
jgi:hypothetical protein